MSLEGQLGGTATGALVQTAVKLGRGGRSGSWQRMSGLNLEADLPFHRRAQVHLEESMTKPKQPNQDGGLANMSVNSSRRSGVDEDGAGNPAHQSGKHDPSESTKVPDQQIPVEKSPEIDETEGHPT
jgi:hypothetical protein